MKISRILGLCLVVALTGCTQRSAQSSSGAPSDFRVRADFTAPLNSDHGWAGALNENVTVQADRPFRLRFEAGRRPGSTGTQPLQLQYRRNNEDWTRVEAHDFPYPERDHSISFANVALHETPPGWSVAHGDSAGLTVVADGQQKVLRASANQEVLIGLYAPPWESNAFTFAAEVRLPAENRQGVGIVFGYVDRRNYGLVFLDAAAGAIRVRRLVDGTERTLTEKKATLVSGQWLEIEIQYEDGELAVNFQDETLEFTTHLGAGIPPSPLGFYIPANTTAEFREFGIEGEPQTPRVSIVACAAYKHGAATTDVLAGSSARFQPGAGVSLAEFTPPWTGAGAHSEFEWALVVRRFADAAVTNEEGDTFEFRMLDKDGTALGTGRNPALRLAIPPGHVGGTFVETPGRVGPWQAATGALYFIMEPTETSNLFMMIKSTDNGRTWREMDGANRPRTGDLESVDGRQVGDTINIIHQVTQSVRYHAFRTSDHPSQPDTWSVRDEQAAAVTSVAQGTSLVVRSDGSMVTFYVGQTIHYSVRSPAGTWSSTAIMDEGIEPKFAGPQAILGVNDTVHLAFYGMDGTIWYRQFLPDGTLTAKQQLASGAGATRAEFGAVLPLVFIPETNTLVVVYRLADGKLWERRMRDGQPTPPVKVTDRNVIRQAVDSQQPGADVVRDGNTVHVLFIEDTSRSIFSTNDAAGWASSTLRNDKIIGSWVRGNVYTRPDGVKVYGYIYDAGSDGGAGMNRFGEVILGGR